MSSQASEQQNGRGEVGRQCHDDDDGGGREGRLVYRVNPDEQIPPLMIEVFREAGWKQFDEESQHPDDWNLWWKLGKFRYPEPHQLLHWQRLNHYPKTNVLSKKDHLCRALKVCREVYGKGLFNFWPLTFNLPSEYNRFLSEFEEREKAEPTKKQYWIVKPADMSRGRGIYMFTDAGELQYSCACIVQQYIERPLLISSYKFDLRLYACVTTFHPLTIYLHDQGLARFSTDKYDLGSLKNPYAHLTNTSINKLNPAFTAQVQGGTKWSLAQLRHYLLYVLHRDDRWLWQRVATIVCLTLISQLHSVSRARSCLELFGIDILIDENLKPWLLEVNYGPQLVCDTVIDVQVKKAMLSDILKLCHFTERDLDRGHVSQSKRRLRSGALRSAYSRYLPGSALSQRRLPAEVSYSPLISALQDYGKRYQEQRVLARKKKDLEQWQNIENVYPYTSEASTNYLRHPSPSKHGAHKNGASLVHGNGCGEDEGSDSNNESDDEKGVGDEGEEDKPQRHHFLPAMLRPVERNVLMGSDDTGGEKYETHPCFNLPILSRTSMATTLGWRERDGAGVILPPASPTIVIPNKGDAHGELMSKRRDTGGFQLIFPFNENTKLKHSTSDEIRKANLEIKKLLHYSRQEINRHPLIRHQKLKQDMLLWIPVLLENLKEAQAKSKETV